MTAILPPASHAGTRRAPAALALLSAAWEVRAKKVAEIRKVAGEIALALLSDEQKKEFEKLQGEKIELPEGALLPPGVGGRRP